jgi:hypothetical protein
MATGKDLLINFRRRWIMLIYLEHFLIAGGLAVLSYMLFKSFLLTMALFVLVETVLILFSKPWQRSLPHISGYLDQQLEEVEYSTGLLLQPKESLSYVSQLQQYRTTQRLKEKITGISPPHHLKRAAFIFVLLCGLALIIHQLGWMNHLHLSGGMGESTKAIQFKAVDSTIPLKKQPAIKSQSLVIQYPTYTRLEPSKIENMNVKAVEGSKLTWQLTFTEEVGEVQIEQMGARYPLELQKGVYQASSILQSSGFYNFRFTDQSNNVYVSELYAIESIKDEPPGIEVTGLQQFTSFSYEEEKKEIAFGALIADDFGIADAYFIATVSKGSGESVKFREEKLMFEQGVKTGFKSMELTKRIRLDEMNMGPGDELYFYIEAKDVKRPQANSSRSETFFAVIKDTTTYNFEVEGTLGVDQMPEYFRSQRQLILDTEKLIKERPKLPKKEFNFKSNELGFDQKALRIKYGAFMGDETEMGEAPLMSEPPVEEEHGEEGEEDLLAGFKHDHDGANEHNLVVEEPGDETKKDPLAEFLHNHDDPEESTLFTQSLRSKLRQALNEMWDAELHLRLYNPEESLPYQYKALKLIQEIKNSARIYVHRIGFDPPPIKEDKRLTGKIEEVSNVQKNQQFHAIEPYVHIKKAIQRLEELLAQKGELQEADKTVFLNAGNELAVKAIDNPGKYLETLQQLKTLSELGNASQQLLTTLQKGLFMVLPEQSRGVIKGKRYSGEINELLLQELYLNDK